MVENLQSEVFNCANGQFQKVIHLVIHNLIQRQKEIRNKIYGNENGKRLPEFDYDALLNEYIQLKILKQRISRKIDNDYWLDDPKKVKQKIQQENDLKLEILGLKDKFRLACSFQLNISFLPD